VHSKAKEAVDLWLERSYLASKPSAPLFPSFGKNRETIESRVGEIEEAAGVYAETKIEELAERKLRFDKSELAQEWDKIQRRERQASIPAIESTQSLGQDLGRSLTLSRVVDEE
jgi:predicted RNase H-like HicB family nuclease